MNPIHWFSLICIVCIHTSQTAGASDQTHLDAAGPEAEKIVESAYKYLGSTWIFEFPEKQIGKTSASCWALSVLVGYDQKRATDRLTSAFESSENIYVRIYALIGLHLINPKNSKWVPLNQSERFLNTYVSVYDPFIAPNRAVTIKDLFRRLESQGGYSSLLLKYPLPDQIFVGHPIRPIIEI